MPLLAPGQCLTILAFGPLWPWQPAFERARTGARATGQVVRQQGLAHHFDRQRAIGRKVVKQGIDQRLGRQAAGLTRATPQPFSKSLERDKGGWRPRCQQQRQGLPKAPRVGDEIPVPRKARETLHRIRVNDPRLLHGIRRLRVIDHGKGFGMTRNRRAAQALQDPELNLVRPDAVQAVKAGGKTLQRLAG